MIQAEAQAIIETIASWVQGRPDLGGLGLAGSWARGVADADSDLDFLILADEPEQYRSDHHWIYQIAFPPPFRIRSHGDVKYGVVWSCHILLEPTAELELTFGHLAWASITPVDDGTRNVVRDGFRTIVDKDGRLARMLRFVQG